MMISKEISASPDRAQWHSIDWKSTESHVLKLQMRIAKATREGKSQSGHHFYTLHHVIHQHVLLQGLTYHATEFGAVKPLG